VYISLRRPLTDRLLLQGQLLVFVVLRLLFGRKDAFLPQDVVPLRIFVRVLDTNNKHTSWFCCSVKHGETKDSFRSQESLKPKKHDVFIWRETHEATALVLLLLLLLLLLTETYKSTSTRLYSASLGFTYNNK